MDFLELARRRAFSLWLRTGRLPRWAKPETPEVKFNPWHDPDDGRFTFRGTGRYFGGGAAGGPTPNSTDAGMARRPREPFGGYGGGGRGFNGGGASGSWDDPRREQGRSGGNRPTRPPERTPRTTTRVEPRRGRSDDHSSGSETARNARIAPAHNGQASHTSSRAAEQSTRSRSEETSATRQGSGKGKGNWQRVERNGYDFHIDDRGRTRRVEGKLTLNEAQSRSRSSQAQAGQPDRRRSDEGGHYIARRFNGPTDAFNHFAQDANFNRGRYRSVENQWAKAIRAGRSVRVKIEPLYEGSSHRPKSINVSFWIDGLKRRVKFPNEPRESSLAKQ